MMLVRLVFMRNVGQRSQHKVYSDSKSPFQRGSKDIRSGGATRIEAGDHGGDGRRKGRRCP